MDTTWLNRRLTSLCGNFFIYVRDSGISIGTDLASSALTANQFLDVKVSADSSYPKDLANIFSKTQSNTFFSGNDLQTISGFIVTTLIINDVVPDRFLVMKKNGSDNENDHTIYKTFDLTNKTLLGSYIRRHVSDNNFNTRPTYVDFVEKTVRVNGVDVSTGSITTKTSKLTAISNENVVKLFSLNNISAANILPLSFDVSDIYEDLSDYYWFYADDVKLGEFTPQGFDSNFIPAINNSIVQGSVEVSNFSGVIINNDTFVPYHYCKTSAGISSCSNIIDGVVNINDKLIANMVIKEEQKISLDKNDDRTILFKLSRRFEQSEKIIFNFSTFEFELIADQLFNKPNFSPTDNERFVFNPAGSIEEQSISLCGAFNYMAENRTNHQLSFDGEFLSLSVPFDYLGLELFLITSDVDIVYDKNQLFPVAADSTQYNLEKDASVGDYLRTNIGYHKILGYTLGNFDGVIKRWVTSKNFSGGYDPDRIWIREKIEFGLFNRYDSSELETIIKKNKSVIEPSILKFLNQTSLVIGETYTITYGSINHDGVDYFSPSVFTASTTEYTSTTLGTIVLIKRYHDDQEVQLFLEKYSDEISTVETSIEDISWVILGVKDSKQEDYELEFSQTQNFFEHDFDPVLNTHSFYLLSNNFGGEFNENDFNLTTKDYFIEYFGFNSSVISNDLLGSNVIFNGAKLRFSENYDGYKFNCLLNLKSHNEADTNNNKLLEFKLLKNDDNKNIVFLINLYVADYKAINSFGDILVDYGYIAMMSGINDGFGTLGNEYFLPNIAGLTYTDQSFRGVKLNHDINQESNPPLNSLEFVGGFIRLDSTGREVNGGFGGVFGINYANGSIISNITNNTQGTGNYEFGDKLEITINNNTIDFVGGQVYVISLNGTVYDQYMPISLLKSIEPFTNYEWYHVTEAINPYERLKKALSLAGINDLLNSNPSDLINNIGLTLMEKPSINGFYNEYFTPNTKEIDVFNGATVYQNWYSEGDIWESYFESWNNLSAFSNLSALFGFEININKLN